MPCRSKACNDRMTRASMMSGWTLRFLDADGCREGSAIEASCIRPRSQLFARVAYPPDTTRAIISHVESAVVTYRYADRPTPDLSAWSDEPGEKILVLSGRLAVLDRNSDHFVAAAIRAIPG